MSEVSQPNEQCEFICGNCKKVIDGLSKEIFEKAYEGHDLCLSCRPSQPNSNDQLSEKLEKALEEATHASNPEWLRALLEENERWHKNSNYNRELYEAQCEATKIVQSQLQQTREELDKQSRYIRDKDLELFRMEKELDQVKAELNSRPTTDAYDAACKALWKHRADNESLRTELSAKDKVLEWYASTGHQIAKDILSKYRGESHE